jgi:hypothetical protein
MSETKESLPPAGLKVEYPEIESSKADTEELSTQPHTINEKGSGEDDIGATEDTKQEDEEIVYPGGLVLAAIVLALCLAVFLIALDQTIIATAIPRITDRFQSVKDIGWYGAVRP